MAKESADLSNETPEMDVSDVEWRVGDAVGGGQLWDPCSSSDVRRWVMAMDYPNPLHWDEAFARKSKFGGLVAPQSIAACLDYGHGVQPACVGHIPGSHLIFGGEEWWFNGVHVRPGDKLFQERRFHDYKVVDTKFAGPTMFSRGDTTHTNQHGVVVARERATSIRYLAKEAEKRGMYANSLTPKPKWTRQQLKDIEKVRFDWIMSNREGVSPRFSDVKVGDKLPRRALGPHNTATFTTEYRAFVFNAWGSYGWVVPDGVKDPWVNQDCGWIDDFGLDYEAAKLDPRIIDGLYNGPSRGHIDDEKAGEIGMSRAYGYGATMAAWNTDYLAFWAGHDGFVRHAKSDFRGPAFEGDVTFFDGEIVDKIENSEWGFPVVQVKVTLSNQDGTKIVTSLNEVQLPY